MKEPTLNEALKARGWSTAPGWSPGRKLIKNEKGEVLAHCNASEAWEYLKAKEIKEHNPAA